MSEDLVQTDVQQDQAPSGHPALRFLYKNYRGETAMRTAIPLRVRFGSSVHHAKEQWLLVAFCLDRQAERSFAMTDIIAIYGLEASARQQGEEAQRADTAGPLAEPEA